MKRGFTLIELLVVIGIIGILAAIVVVSMSGGTDKARITKGQAFSAKIGIELADSLISEWRFDEGTGSTVNDAWGANSGTLQGDPTWMSGGDCVSVNCLEFDGTGDYINCGTDAINFAMGNGDHTLEAWIYPITTISGYDYVIAIGDNTGDGKQSGIGIYTGNVLFISADTPTEETTYVLPSLNKWYHLVMSYNGTTDIASFYVNGEWKENKTITIGTIVGQCRIGVDIGNTNNWNGRIDEIKVYSGTADFAQIQSNYLAGLQKLFSKGAISQKEYNQRIKKIVLE